MNELLACVDPQRGMMGVLWDHIAAAELDDQGMTKEERERRRAVYAVPMLW